MLRHQIFFTLCNKESISCELHSSQLAIGLLRPNQAIAYADLKTIIDLQKLRLLSSAKKFMQSALRHIEFGDSALQPLAFTVSVSITICELNLLPH